MASIAIGGYGFGSQVQEDRARAVSQSVVREWELELGKLECRKLVGLLFQFSYLNYKHTGSLRSAIIYLT